MLSSRIWYLLMLLLPLSAFSQRTAYSYISRDREEDYHFSVVGAVGPNIHIWEIPKFKPPHTPAKTFVHFMILSDGMRLIDKKDLLLDEDPVSYIYSPVFERHEHSYYVSIRYKVRLADVVLPRSLLLEIDENGQILNRSDNMELAHAPPINQVTPSFSVTSRDQMLYAVVAGADSVTRHLTVRKTQVGDTSVSEQQFSVRTYRLTYPKLSLTEDSTLWVTSLAEPGSKYPTDGGRHDLLFLARLDTTLTLLEQPRLAPFNAPPHNKDENYIPEYLLPSDSNLFIISTGRVPTAVPSYRQGDAYPRIYDPRMPDPSMTTMLGGPIYRNGYQTIYLTKNLDRSLRITLASPSLSILHDTIIDAYANGATLELDNYFYSGTDNGIELLYSQQFPRSYNGIRYFLIDRQGGMEEKDMVVDLHFHYLLYLAKRIAPSVLIVPFTYKGKMGFQKLYPRINS